MIFNGDIREFDELWAVLKQETNLTDDVVISDEHNRERAAELVKGEYSDILVIKEGDEIVGVMDSLFQRPPWRSVVGTRAFVVCPSEP